MARPKPLKAEEVLRIVSSAPGLYGRVVPSRHFREQANDRGHFDIQDAIKVLSEATTAKSVWNGRSRSWNYDLRGKDIEGRELTVRIAVESGSNEVILVTAF